MGKRIQMVYVSGLMVLAVLLLGCQAAIEDTRMGAQSPGAPAAVYLVPRLPLAERVEGLLSRMTLEERITV